MLKEKLPGCLASLKQSTGVIGGKCVGRKGPKNKQAPQAYRLNLEILGNRLFISLEIRTLM